MKKTLIRIILAGACLLLFPALLTHANNAHVLAPAKDSPSAWLSARAGSAAYTHDLRVILAIPSAINEESVTVHLSFSGNNPPADLTRPLSELTLYRTVKAGSTVYAATEDATLRVLTLTGLADGSYQSVTLTVNHGTTVLYRATQSAETIGKTADLALIPWDGVLTEWMSALPDTRSLAELTIPGTHDSGATINLLGGLFGQSKCQTLSIADQLSAGVRFLDIRLKLQNGKLKVYHGIVDQELTFDEVLSACKSFLEAHPGETILMSIKQEDDNNASFPSAIAEKITSDSSLWYTQNRLPKLGEARGKIVLFRRYGDASIGINCANNWADNTDFNMNNGVSMRVQDFYNIGNNAGRDTKWSKIQSLIATAAQTDNTFCLNFSSGYTGTANITNVSNYINPKLLEHFQSLPRGGYGTFVIDFITPEIATALIATNFPA